MKKVWRKYRKTGLVLSTVVVLGLASVGLASCGSTTAGKTTKTSAVKTPPGVDSTQAATTTPTASTSSTATGNSTQGTTDTQTQSKTPSVAADLYGGRFTIVNATRPDTNKSVISSSGREVKGDYLEVEFTIADVATDHLVDLSEYSFRLSSPGIAASSYEDYYGTTTTYGGYVSTHVISASLLDYTSLSPVAYKVKVGETVTKVFCFFDLNPENVARNTGVTKDNTTVIIKKISGTDYGDSVSIPLAGYPD
jgi:hypothetical protein